MLVNRLLVTIVLVPIGMAIIVYGKLPLILTIAIIVALAGWEYVKLLRIAGHHPSMGLVPVAAALFVLMRGYDGFTSAPWLISLLLLISMSWHLLDYEKGRDQAGSDFNITIGGALYLGWIGAYLISLRDLPEGKWWFLVVMPAVWLADSGAYFIGSRFGKHKLSPRLSPRKSWEGYLAGIVAGTLAGAFFAALWRIGAGPESAIIPWRGAVIGFVVAILTPLGDLGESMFKRQVGVKDSSHLIPGMGGVFDRIDSWLWGGVIGYYLIVWFF
ncbi:MAG: phosphatidate cytidylyltransferase [Anaerolineales bacterium]|nr:phosphatidate cytidylyltransferase [Anaerolineales bacterium]